MLAKQGAVAFAAVGLVASICLAMAWASTPKPQLAVGRYAFQYFPDGPRAAIYFVTDNAENKVYVYHNDAIEGSQLKGVFDLTSTGQPTLDWQPSKAAEVITRTE